MRWRPLLKHATGSREVSWDQDDGAPRNYSFWTIKTLDLRLVLQALPEGGPAATPSTPEDRSTADSNQDVLECSDPRIFNSHTAQAVEMKYYLNARDMDRASTLLSKVIMPQISVSLRRETGKLDVNPQWASKRKMTANPNPDLPALIQVAYEFLFLKHAAEEGDAQKMSFHEIGNALQDESFWGENQLCCYFTHQDLELMLYEDEVDETGFSRMLGKIRCVCMRACAYVRACVCAQTYVMSLIHALRISSPIPNRARHLVPFSLTPFPVCTLSFYLQHRYTQQAKGCDVAGQANSQSLCGNQQRSERHGGRCRD